MHTDSMLKLRIRTSMSDIPSFLLPPNSANMYFGIR